MALDTPVAVVVMGVAGCGKSVVGAQLAERIGVPFLDADSLHPAANIEKMRSGHPLDDHDRAPWLDLVAARMAAHPDGIVVACSALKRAYRDRLRGAGPRVRFVHLDGSVSLLQERLDARAGHFMPPSLLESQFAALEQLRPDEDGISIDVAAPVQSVVDAAQRYLGSGV